MRLTKLQSRILAVGVLVLVFGIGFLLTRTKKEFGTIPTIEVTRDADGSFDAKVVFGEFQKSEVKDGKKLWEIHAKTGRYSPEKGLADLEFPVVTIYKTSDTIVLTADKARINLTQTSLNRVDAQGNVVAHALTKDLTLKTTKALYDKDADTLNCPGHVEITGPQGTLSGDELQGTVDVKDFVLKKNVHTFIKAEVKKQDGKTRNAKK